MAVKDMNIPISGPTTASERQKKKETLAKQYNYLRDKSRQKVKGKFIYHEVPGGVMSFTFGPIYRGDEAERYDLLDGGIYELPLGVAKHLNNNVWYPEYGYIPGEANVSGYNSMMGTGMKITAKVRRCSFQSLEFLEIEDMPSGDIVSVEKVV